MRKQPFFTFERILGLLIPCCFVFLSGHPVLQSLEWHTHALTTQLSPKREPSPDVVIVAIDDASLELLGDQPWPLIHFATLTQQLHKANASVIAYAMPLNMSQHLSGQTIISKYIANNASTLDTSALDILNDVKKEFISDQGLARSFERADNIILGLPYTPLSKKPTESNLPASLDQHTITQEESIQSEYFDYLPFHKPAQIKTIAAPTSRISRVIKKAGVLQYQNYEQRLLSPTPLVLQYDKHALPAFELAAAFPNSTIKINPHNSIVAGAQIIPTDDLWTAFPYFYATDKKEPLFKTVSLVEILYGGADPATFSGKTVLIGITSNNATNYLTLPNNNKIPPVLLSAHLVSNLLNTDLYKEAYIQDWHPLISFLIIAFYLIFILPRLHLVTGAIITVAIIIVAVNLQIALIIIQHMRLPMATPILALLIGHFIIAIVGRIRHHFQNYQVQLSNSQRALGQAYQAQGNLDGAFEALQKCFPDDDLLSSLYNLGLDFERRRFFNKAIKVFNFIRSHDKNYKDVQAHIKQNIEYGQSVTLGQKIGKVMPSSLLVTNSTTEKPILGRYQIVKEIGKGAMGTVFLGRDPKIGRTVAIKTISLSGDDPDMADVKKRFFREAETAGRLSHKNIVAIHDVGEEHDLAYIAMDFLPGMPLSEYIKPRTLLPAKDVMGIAIQIAGALDYAHQERVVHRDIKPANIIYDPKTKICRITDFGIAHITDMSNTATGTILGSPNYMSPEQLMGRKIDGRSDIFSLGVTIYQLLCGELPFSGDTLSSLMYNIANKKHPDIRNKNDSLPNCIAAILNKCLQKEASKRCASGGELSTMLQVCIKNF